MSKINDLKEAVDTKLSTLILLNIATLGLYSILWLYEKTPVIEKVTQKKIAGKTFLIWLAVCLGWGGVSPIPGVEIIVASVLWIIWGFKAKKAIEEYALEEFKVDLRMNGLYVILFNIFYICYCANDLPEALRKRNIVMGQETATPSNG